MNILPAVLAGITVYLIIVILFHKVGTQHDTVRRRLEHIGNSAKNQPIINEEINKPLSERIFKPLLKSLTGKLIRPKAATDFANGEKGRQTGPVKKMLNQAGFSITAAEYEIIRLFVIIGCSVLFAAATLALQAQAPVVIMSAFLGLFLGYSGMRFFLTRSITKRKKLMEQQLPDVLDLLSISVEAGLGFEQAINHITTNMEGPLIDELTVTYREMSMGRTRKESLFLLGERCDIDDLKTFVTAVAQAAQLGISIKNVLKSQAAAMRQARKAKVQEQAMKISIKMLFPMVLFIFPVIFIILLGPAIVNVLKVIKG